jgi:hypothetical protein
MYANELEDVVANVRWLTTLVLAEVAGLVKYRELGKGESLSLPFALVILGLCGSLVCFVVAITLARRVRMHVATEAQKAVRHMTSIANDATVAPASGDLEVWEILDSWWTAAQSQKSHHYLEIGGLVFFGASSILSAIAIFLTEITALFRR